MVLIKFLLVAYLIYFIVKLLFRNFIKKTLSNSFFDNYQSNQSTVREETTKPEGSITIKENQKKNKKIDKNIGEYVDYEDVKD